MFDPLSTTIMLSNDLENERLRANCAEGQRDELHKALAECVKLLEASMFITPDNSIVFKSKISSFKKILNTIQTRT